MSMPSCNYLWFFDAQPLGAWASAHFLLPKVELLIIIFYGILYVLTVYDLLSIKISILGV